MKEELLFNDFLTLVRDPNREYNYYFAEEDVPFELRADVEVPWLVQQTLDLSRVAYWHGIGTVSLPHTDAEENFMCVLSGWKEFTIVSPF